MDFQAVRDLGLNAFVLLSILGLAIWMVKKTFAMLEAKEAAFLVMLKDNADERTRWLTTYEKQMEKIDRALGYMKEEHEEQMEVLHGLKLQVMKGA